MGFNNYSTMGRWINERRQPTVLFSSSEQKNVPKGRKINKYKNALKDIKRALIIFVVSGS